MFSKNEFLICRLVRCLDLYVILSSGNTENVTSSFPAWMPFASYFCLIALVWTSSAILNTSAESEHHCLCQYQKKCFLRSPAQHCVYYRSVMRALSHIVEHFIPDCWEIFFFWKDDEFYRMCFSASTEWSYYFCSSVCWHDASYPIYKCGALSQLTWPLWVIFLMCYRIEFANIGLRIFHPCSPRILAGSPALLPFLPPSLPLVLPCPFTFLASLPPG